MEDDLRLRESLPTVRWLSEKGGRVILLSHLGRPRGRPEPSLSLAPVAKRLTELLGTEVPLVSGITGAVAEAAVAGLTNGQVLLLQNLRFDPGEKANDSAFTTALASLGDLYVPPSLPPQRSNVPT